MHQLKTNFLDNESILEENNNAVSMDSWRKFEAKLICNHFGSNYWIELKRGHRDMRNAFLIVLG
jgi:hypothetical protein